ncbi:MAG TPA: fibronectin type III domain-containing protein [Gemmatimonadales bacterium]|nr:fibronectin type III domain-containing protein [Gemmatimonadales bacterium]
MVTATSQFAAPGDTVRFVAQVIDSAGHVLPAEPVTWTSSTPAVARVDGDGLVTADSIGATTITAAAGGKRGSVDLTVQEIALCECTKILDSTAVTVVSRDDSTGRYVFRVLRGPPPVIKVGDIIVGAQGAGYLRRVQSSVLAGDLLTLETSVAYVEEAVRDGGFETTVDTDAPTGDPQPGGGRWLGPWKTTYLAPGAGVTAAGGCCSMNGLAISLKIGGDVAGTLEFTIKEGTIGYVPKSSVGAQVTGFQLRQFHSIFTGDLGLLIDEYELKVSLAGSKNVTEKLAKESKNFVIQQRPYAGFIGPMPVLIIFTKKIGLEITPAVTASAVFTGSFRTGLHLNNGLRWTSGGGWNPVAGAVPFLEATAPTFQSVEGTAAVKIAVVPELSLQFYGVAGPFVNLEPYAEAKAAVAATFADGDQTGLDWLLNIALGLDLNMGAKLSILGRKDLATIGFKIPLVKPKELIRNFSDGPLTVRTRTTGEDLPTGYAVRLRPAFTDALPLLGLRNLSTSNRDTAIGVSDSVTLADVRSGTGFPHRLELRDVAGNCFVSDTNPASVAISSGSFIAIGGAPADTAFDVNCIPLGDLRLRTVVSGPNPPARFSVTLQRRDTVGVGRADSAERVSIPGGPAPADTVLEDFVPLNPLRGGTGRLDVTLSPSRRNCAAALPTTDQVVIPSGDTVTSQFSVTCVPLGRIRLHAVTFDADVGPATEAVVFAPLVVPAAPIDSVPVQPGPVPAGDSALVGELVPLYNASGAPGKYTVDLGGAPNRCTDVAAFSRGVTVFPGDTAVAAFEVRCVERLQVITQTTGPGSDPDGYELLVENDDASVDTVRVAVNDTVGIAGVVPGLHLVRLAGVEPSCSAAGGIEVTVDGRDSTLAVLSVSCPAPPAPTGLAPTHVDSNRIDLAWTPVPPPTPVGQYRVYRDGVLHDSSTTASYDDTGLTPYTAFAYQVSAVSPTGLEGARSAAVTVRTLDATPPTAPTALAVTPASGTAMELTWAPAADAESGVAEYVVYRDGTEVGRTGMPAFADVGLTPLTTYAYRVRAVNGDGLEGPLSEEASGTTLDGTPPSGPTSLVATAVSASEIALSWTAADDPESGIQSYNVYRDGALVGGATTTSFADIGLLAATSYTYVVAAVNGVGVEGPPSLPATATTFPDATPPSAPVGLTAVPLDAGAIDLAWAPASDAESGIQAYRVYRDGAFIGATATTRFTDIGLAASTAYTYRVSAVNGAGLEGPMSDPATATTAGTQRGELVVNTVTNGTGTPDGYLVKVLAHDYLSLRTIPATGTRTFTDLLPKTYLVWLLFVPHNCSVADTNPRLVELAPGASASTTFALTCE